MDDKAKERLIKEAEVKVIRTRIKLMNLQEFYGGLSLGLEPTPEFGLGTVATDGVHFFYDPEVVLRKFSFEEMIGLWAHEAGGHCALGHPWRGMAMSNKYVANLAMDCAVNPPIIHAGLKLPGGAVMPSDWGMPEGQSAEWYYNKLMELGEGEKGSGENGEGEDGEEGEGQEGDGSGQSNKPDSGHSHGKGKHHTCGGVRPVPGKTGQQGDKHEPTAAEIAKLRDKWNGAVKQAAKLAQERGQLPAGWEHLIEHVGEVQPDIEEVLYRFMQEQRRDDFRLFPFNRKFLAQGIYLPGMCSEGMGELAVVFDTSGSVPDAHLNYFLAKLNSVAEQLRPRKVHVIACDAKVQSYSVLDEGEFPISCKEASAKKMAYGRGGTAFKPAFDYIDKHDIRPVCLVYLTDMYGESWGEVPKPDFPVLWAATNDRVAPPENGETCKVEIPVR